MRMGQLDGFRCAGAAACGRLRLREVRMRRLRVGAESEAGGLERAEAVTRDTDRDQSLWALAFGPLQCPDFWFLACVRSHRCNVATGAVC